MKINNQKIQPLQEAASSDAIEMLIADHRRVAKLFAQFKQTKDGAQPKQKAALVARICQELTVHTLVEEELFYPAVRKIIHDDDDMDEALVEHAGAKQLIAELKAAEPASDLYDAKVTVLGEQIDHHVEEEEGSMFPRARHAGLDARKLGVAILARKSQLWSEITGVATSGRGDVESAEPAPYPMSHRERQKKATVKAKKKRVKPRSVVTRRRAR